MATPLRALSPGTVNSRDMIEDNEDEITWNMPPSSPFVENVDAGMDQENVAPAAASLEAKPHSMKLFEDNDDYEITQKLAPRRVSLSQTGSAKSPAKDCFSPLKVNSPRPLPKIPDEERPLRENEGLTMAVQVIEDERMADVQRPGPPPADETFMDGVTEYHEAETTAMTATGDEDIDNTCFSNFSEIPNADMTAFARLKSPAKLGGFGGEDMATPRPNSLTTPRTSRKADSDDDDISPTPRRGKTPKVEGDTTNLLLDFTQQMEAFSTASRRSPSRRHSPTKSQAESTLRSHLNSLRSPRKSSVPSATPSRGNLLNLLDFELPPPATPRSVPSITIREMESLKSSFQSQISSLTASLSGKEAEVESLIRAVNDAEHRVGQAQEQVREERCAREDAERQRLEWEKKGVEVEEVLRSIKKEVIRSEKEREDLTRQLEEAERRAEEAEARASELEARAIEAEGKIVDTTQFEAAGPQSQDGPSSPRFTAEEVQKQIDEKVATLCRELHVVYKKKHETKVAALKKSYEAKAEKKASELQKKIGELVKQNEELQNAKDSTFSGVIPDDFNREQPHAVDLTRMEQQKAELEEQKARLAGLMEEMKQLRAEHQHTLRELEQERVEKGELVAAAEQMLALQAEMNVPQPPQKQETPPPPPPAHEEIRRGSVSKPSGLKGPGFGMARSGGSSKSRMMSNIERMGARAAQ